MDAQKINFMVSIQQEIDKLEANLGVANPTIISLKNQFENLWQSEIQGTIKSKENNTHNYQALLPIKLDTEAIRSHLEMKGDLSINYDFIKNERVKKQLIKDNLKMENSRLDILNDTERFYNFCVNAFYQIEELINYYLSTKYSFKEFISLLSSQNSYKVFNQKQMSEISIAEKIFVFEGLFYFKQVDLNGKKIYYESIITFIRKVRNEDSHRCNIIERDTEQTINKFKDLLKTMANFKKNRAVYTKTKEDEELEKQAKLIYFIKEKNYNLVRDTIQSLALKINQELTATKKSAAS